MEFCDLYPENSQSRGTRPIRVANGTIYKYNFVTKKTEEYDQENIIHKSSIVEVIINGENILTSCSTVIQYTSFMKTMICKEILKLKEIRDNVEVDAWHFDFVSLLRLTNYLAKQSIHGEILVSNPKLLYAIDAASGGGALIAKPGIHHGHYFSYDINNSYNNFFVKYKIPSNPVIMSVSRIFKKQFALYRLKVHKEFLTEDMTRTFKTNRAWFTYTDTKIFDMFGIKYELVNENYNCVDFKDKIDTDFEWMHSLNAAKYHELVYKSPMKRKIIKHLLSSFWGNMCKYNCITEKEYGREIPEYLYHKKGKDSGDELFINPDKFYIYAVGICKPFVLAEGRYNLLSQVHKVQKLGHELVYCHTDNIITTCPPEHFDIGTDIGQWKRERDSTVGIDIKNIAEKKFIGDF